MGSMEISIQTLFHEVLVSTWENEIKDDYANGWLLKEDSLKTALYYHLRSKLGSIMEACDLQIYTEFTDGEFLQSGRRPDIVIARVKLGDASLRESILECAAVIEIKYKNSFNAKENIYADYDKLREYVEQLGVGCRLYMATIWECEDHPTTWIRKNAAWAKGIVTELNASYVWGEPGTMQFYHHDH